jgi:SET domain-containing protein
MTKNSGWGFYTAETLAPGQYVNEYLGEVIVTAEYEKRFEDFKSKQACDLYFASLGSELYIDARNAGNATRFINSSCTPNCKMQKMHDCRVRSSRLGFFALREIAKGEELTFSYNFSFTLCTK